MVLISRILGMNRLRTKKITVACNFCRCKYLLSCFKILFGADYPY